MNNVMIFRDDNQYLIAQLKMNNVIKNRQFEVQFFFFLPQILEKNRKKISKSLVQTPEAKTTILGVGHEKEPKAFY